MNVVALRAMTTVIIVIAIICVTGIVLAQPLPIQGAKPEQKNPMQPPIGQPTQSSGLPPAQAPSSSDVPPPSDQPIFREPEQPQAPVEAPFKYQHAYTTELRNGRVDITNLSLPLWVHLPMRSSAIVIASIRNFVGRETLLVGIRTPLRSRNGPIMP